MIELSIIPECYVDTKVAEILGKASRKYNHQHGCGDVANLMKKCQDRICLGIIDEDKNKGPEIEKWLLNDAMAINLDPADEKFRLPPGLKGFRSISKTQDIDRNEGFKRFIKGLINNNAPSVTTLQRWLDLYKSGTINNLCADSSQK